jgi:hypothetical protein
MSLLIQKLLSLDDAGLQYEPGEGNPKEATLALITQLLVQCKKVGELSSLIILLSKPNFPAFLARPQKEFSVISRHQESLLKIFLAETSFPVPWSAYMKVWHYFYFEKFKSFKRR